MADLSRPQLALCVLGAVVAVALGLSRLGGEDDPVAPPQAAAPIGLQEDGGGAARVVVHVAGAVRRPGVYKLSASARVDDAVTRAGGATRRADLSGLNLAAKVADGRQVLVPERARSAGGAAPAGGAAAAAGAAAAEGQPLNVNTATLEQLDLL